MPIFCYAAECWAQTKKKQYSSIHIQLHSLIKNAARFISANLGEREKKTLESIFYLNAWGEEIIHPAAIK